MKKLLGAVVALLVAVTPLAASAHQPDGDLKLSFVKAPVAPDGTTAGAALDFVVNFADPDPSVDGIGMKAGATVTVTLDPAFDLTGNQGFKASAFPPPPAVIMLQGWPQSPRVTPTPYDTDIAGNTITLTLVSDWDVGAFGPGPKSLHLALLLSTNPAKPGRYSVDVAIRPDPASSDVLEGHGRVKIIRKVKPSVNVVSLFSGSVGPPPLFNPLYQELELGEPGRSVGMYLWARGGEPVGDVSIEMDNPRRGRLVQEGETVGKIKIKVPKGAHDQTLAIDEFGSFIAPAFVTDVPTRVLITTFTPDPAVAGEYTVRFKMNGGNSQTMHYDVSGP